MKKILVPVDFSSHTEITCRYAIEFAKAYSAEIRLFHTYFDQIIIADTSFPDTLDMSTIYNEELMKEIFRQAERNMA
ncbi:MAG: universal stress protein, partial [Bacteroidota bacterium]